tara:strand:- start:46 stop:615 length:570 start_codon:yes stop_codon:yes gene_type:complete
MKYDICGDSTTVVHPLFQEEDDGSIPISPLQLLIEETNVNKVIELNELWHSVLPQTSKSNLVRNRYKIFFVATYKNRYYASAIWTSPVASNRIKNGLLWLELRRFAISNNAPKNTATRMLSIMKNLIHKKFPEILGLLSYQAIDHHKGTIYKAAGWVSTKKSKSVEWHIGKKRNKMQTKSDKIRWELTY